MTNGTRSGEGSASRPGRSLLSGKTRYPLGGRLGGSHGRSGQVRKISPPTGIRSTDRPAHSQLLYRLRYPAHNFFRHRFINSRQGCHTTYSLIHETLLQFEVAFRTQVPATGPQPEPHKSSTPPLPRHTTSMYVFMSFAHLRLEFPSGLFHLIFPTHIFHTFVTLPVHAICPAHLMSICFA